MYEHPLHHFKPQLNSCRPSFFKSIPALTSPVSYLDYVSALAISQRQVSVVNFDVSSVFYFVHHCILSQKRDVFEILEGSFSFLRSLLTNHKYLLGI
jgi:hypothetical protein